MKSENQFSVKTEKEKLRKVLLQKRRNVENKTDKDNLIYERLISFDAFNNAKNVLCYVSLSDEVSTEEIINYALKNKKKVAVPFCKNKNGDMDFYFISSTDELVEGTFGIPEPVPDNKNLVKDFPNSVIIVPALSFSENGTRIGYGSGYYDTFLKKYPFISVGLCYNSLINNEIPTDKFDIPVDFVITESHIYGG